MGEMLQNTNPEELDKAEQDIYAGIRAVMGLAKEHLIEDYKADRVIDEYLDKLNQINRARGHAALHDVEVAE